MGEGLRGCSPHDRAIEGFGWVDEKPLVRPREATRGASYLSKYLAKWHAAGTFEASETVTAAGRTLLTYVNRDLTTLTGCTVRALRNSRLVWACREGHLDELRFRAGRAPWSQSR